MATGKVKTAGVLAMLILAGAMLPALAKVAGKAEAGEQQIKSADLPESEQSQNDNSNLQSQDDSPVSLTGTPGTLKLFYKMLFSVFLVIILGTAVVYISKKLMPRLTNSSGKQIRVIETTHLAPRKGLHLIQVGTQRLLIASTNDSVTMLADVTCSATSFENQLEASITENR